jgi:hypothetical protein
LISARLVERAKGRYSVVDRRELIKIARDSVLIYGDDDAFFKRVHEQAGADVIVSGSYSAAGTEASIDVKAVDAKTLAVIAAATASVARTQGLDRMLARRMLGGKAADAGAESTASTPETLNSSSRGVADPLELDAGLFYEGGDGRLYPLRDGMVLNSKDNYALYVKPDKPCYVYAYQVDSSQKAFKIFPNPKFAKVSNPLPAIENWIPEGGDFLFLDENPGREEIYVFATRTPTAALEDLKTIQLSDIKTAIKTMGLAGRRGSQTLSKVRDTAGNPLELITRRLSTNGDFFWKTTFIHQ